MIGNWLKRRKSRGGEVESGNAVATNLAADRYAGKPMLRLLESYVLWAIDELPVEELLGLDAISPKLTQMFGGDGTWQSAIATTMDLPANMPELIRERWGHNQAIAAANSVDLHSQQFAEMFVDANLA